MGNCASSQYPKRARGGGGGGCLKWPSTAKVVHVDGRLQEFRQPIKVSHVLSQNPNCFLCNSESMDIDCQVPQVPGDEELQLGQIYFLMPLSKSQAPLSLQELCLLAGKASVSLNRTWDTPQKKCYLIRKEICQSSADNRQRCNISISFGSVGVNFSTGRGSSNNQLSTKIC